jgi:hypothetical protein
MGGMGAGTLHHAIQDGRVRRAVLNHVVCVAVEDLRHYLAPKVGIAAA